MNEIQEEINKAASTILDIQFSIRRTNDTNEKLLLIEKLKTNIDKYSDLLAIFIYEVKGELDKIKEANK